MDIKDHKKPVKIFCCYAREDQQLLRELKKHLKLWEQRQLISLWADTNISPGMNWQKEISRYLDSAHIILLLVSANFLASDYCYSTEMIHAMERYERGEARVIPIILSSCVWEDAPFGELQALPTDAKPITSSEWHTLDEALTDVVRGLREVITTVAAKSRIEQSYSHALIEGSQSQDRNAGQETQASALQLSEQPHKSLNKVMTLPAIGARVPPVNGFHPSKSAVLVTLSGPIKSIIRVLRLLSCGITFILYWLLIGYTTPSIFPDEILRISGSTYLTMLLQGNSHKTQVLKILVVLSSLTADWFLVGILLSHVPHPNLFTLQDASVYGPILVAICAF
jgi:hypothetical protein